MTDKSPDPSSPSHILDSPVRAALLGPHARFANRSAARCATTRRHDLRLVLAVAHEIRERGDTPFLRTGARNANAIRLYETLGFRLRREVAFGAHTAPSEM